ncbi:MAG: Rha family transcriptional regulator [Azoarcus sp.]|jgi:Rha family phage regulatory protein|nr:Rha family transcriptional regulator [Azoarcus sp.]
MHTQPELFPETLLVSHDGERIYTDSLSVAAHFEKTHRDVLRKIRHLSELQSVAFTERNFALSEYLDPTGRRLPKYELTHDGFAMLGMTFTGQKAALFREDFLAAFHAMERELAARDRRYVRALAQVRPTLIPVVEMTKKGMGRAAIAAPLGKSPAAVTYHRRAARSLGLLEGRAA